jgi:serine protease AprX
VVVAAAGNMGEYNGAGTNGYATIGAPGNDPFVITVGATNTHGTGAQTSQTVTSYSSKGPTTFDHIVKPDLVAPGNAVVTLLASPNTTLITEYPQLAVFPCNGSGTNCGSQNGSAKYMRMSGTSMATPVVSGVAALLLQQNPFLTPDQVKARLMTTAWQGFGQYTTATDLGTGATRTRLNLCAQVYQAIVTRPVGRDSCGQLLARSATSMDWRIWSDTSFTEAGE